MYLKLEKLSTNLRQHIIEHYELTHTVNNIHPYKVSKCMNDYLVNMAH